MTSIFMRTSQGPLVIHPNGSNRVTSETIIPPLSHGGNVDSYEKEEKKVVRKYPSLKHLTSNDYTTAIQRLRKVTTPPLPKTDSNPLNLSVPMHHFSLLNDDSLMDFISFLSGRINDEGTDLTIEEILENSGVSIEELEFVFETYVNSMESSDTLSEVFSTFFSDIGQRPVQTSAQDYDFYQEKNWINCFISAYFRISSHYDRPLAIGSSTLFERIADLSELRHRGVDFHIRPTLLDSWKLNSRILRLEAMRRRPITDLDGQDDQGNFVNNDRFFLCSERSTLFFSGYRFHDGLWIPPDWDYDAELNMWSPHGWQYDTTSQQWHPQDWIYHNDYNIWLPRADTIDSHSYLEWQAPGWIYDLNLKRYRPQYLSFENKKELDSELRWKLDIDQITHFPKKQPTYSKPTIASNYSKATTQINVSGSVSIYGSVPKTLDRVAGALQSQSIDELAHHLLQHYPEVRWLTWNASHTPEGNEFYSDKTFVSERCFGKKSVEFDRTVAGIQTLVWILRDEQNRFNLSDESYQKLRTLTLNHLSAEEISLGKYRIPARTLNRALTFLITDDLKKMNQLIRTLAKETGAVNISAKSTVAEMLKKYPDRLYSFNRLASDDKHIFIQAFEGRHGSTYNHGHTVQLEGLPGSLRPLLGMNSPAWQTYYFSWIYSLAGAKGHKNQESPSFSDKSIEWISASESIWKNINSGKMTLKQAYDFYLYQRSILYGFNPENSTEYALTRLAAQFRLKSKEEAKILSTVFRTLPKIMQKELVEELCKSGTVESPGVLLYYAPAVFANARSALQKKYGSTDPSLAIDLTLRAFHKLYKVIEKYWDGHFSKTGLYELNIKELALAFLLNPQCDELTEFDIIQMSDDKGYLVVRQFSKV